MHTAAPASLRPLKEEEHNVVNKPPKEPGHVELGGDPEELGSSSSSSSSLQFKGEAE